MSLTPDIEALLEAERRGEDPPSGAQDRVRNRVLVSAGLIGATTAMGAAGANAATTAGTGATGAGAAGVSASAGSAGIASGIGLAPMTSAVGTTVKLALAAKWIAVVAVSTTVGLGAGIGIHRKLMNDSVATTANAHKKSAVRSGGMTAPVSAAPPIAAPTATPAIALPMTAPPAAVPSPAAPTASHQVRHESRVAKPETESDLREERALLDEAREALARHDAEGALLELSTHGSRFPHGQLAEERESLRIRALFDGGDHASAARRARAFLERHPKSLFGPSVESIAKQIR